MDLHCVICVDEFDLKERTPVVLPCGHTYICKVCAGKIKICHECREPLYWHPPKPQPNNHAHRSPATGRYSRYNNQHHNRYSHSPSTPPHPALTVKQEEVQLPCPKNVVLMEMIEAKQRQERLVAEEKALQDKKRAEKLAEKERKRAESRNDRLKIIRRADTTPGSFRPGTMPSGAASASASASASGAAAGDFQAIEVDFDTDIDHPSHHHHQAIEEEEDEEDFSDYDDEISSSSSAALPLGDPQLISGYAALSGTCGTYAVREPEGLVVLPHDPTRPKYQQEKLQKLQHPQHLGDEKKEEDEYDDIHRRFSTLFVRKDDEEEEEEESGGDDNRNRPGWTRTSREPFTIDEGQKVQVVGVLESNEQGVYQLARGAGYVVATNKQLVKVGGPLETSCKLEGMLQSVIGQQQELQKKLNEVTSLSMALRKEIILEQDKPEEAPVITPSTKKKTVTIGRSEREVVNAPTDESNATFGGPHPMTPTKGFTPQPYSGSPVEWKQGIVSVPSADSTAVELGANFRTPVQGPNENAPYIAEHPLEEAYNRQQNHYSYSPARSCPTPTNHTATTTTNSSHLDQPYLDDESYGNGVLRYRVNNDDELSGMGWAGVLGCGSSLFGERVVQPSHRGDSAVASNIFQSSSNGFGLSLDQNTLIHNSNVQRRAAALAHVAVGSAHTNATRAIDCGGGQGDSPLRRGGSFDGGAGVNFRGGYSNHGGLGRTRRNVFDPQANHHNQHHRHSGVGPSHNTDVHYEPRRQLMMSQMSQHRGVGVASIQHRSPGVGSVPRRGSNGHPDLVQTISR
mmetsp:Transcript_20004/g.46765  ORF Transcript_20004/g.46765 Transcript_20004/m.46765 type:complete len:797 (-) Transcript_20004:3014-5404(-)